MAGARKNWRDLFGDETEHVLSLMKPDQSATMMLGFDFNPHRLKGLYMDYRFFDAQTSPTNFRSVCNRVSREFSQPEVRRGIQKLRDAWDNTTDFHRWHGHPFAEMIDLLFNAALFHQDEKKLGKFNGLMEHLDDITLHSILLVGLKDRLVCIKTLDHVLTPLREVKNSIQM